MRIIVRVKNAADRKELKQIQTRNTQNAHEFGVALRKRNVEVEGVRAEISRRLMTAVNGIKNAVETSINGKKRKKNTGIPYAIKLNSGCIEICQFRISFDTLLPPSSYKMLIVDNLRINWRNKSILEPFDVVDGETDVVYVDDSLLGE